MRLREQVGELADVLDQGLAEATKIAIAVQRLSEQHHALVRAVNVLHQRVEDLERERASAD